MREIRCDECGETLSAPDDETLVERLWEHHAHDHDELDRADAEQLVADCADDAE